MKKIFAVLAAAFVAVAGMAQDMTDNYLKVYAGYNNFSFEDAEESMNGFAVGANYAFNVTNQKLPMFIETGLQYAYASKNEATLQTLSIPVLFTYKFGNDQFNVAPFIGETFRVGLSFDDNGHSAYDSIEDGGLDFNRFQGVFNVGVNFNVQKFTIGYSFNMSENSMVPDEIKIVGQTIAKNKALADYQHLITVGYCF